ncbi:hypothetical protein KAF25_001911, partial [Fusarium avenaceum]
MPSRRPHFKSRHGCKQCKAAHVKCDLSRPMCGRCFEKNNDCEFLSSTTPSTVDDPKSLTTLAPTKERILAPRASFSEVETLPWEDLELLHHFSTVTYSTLANRQDLLQMWQIRIPKMAMKQRFLMHILFSVTSLHIASSRPEDASAYIDRAIRHNNIALREYRSKLHSITPENSPSIFACSTLLIIAALRLSASGPHREPVGAIEEIAGIFVLTQGVRLVLSEMRDWIRQSEIAPLFLGRELDGNIILPKDVADALGLLEKCNQQSADSGSDKQAYALAIQGLKACFMHLQSKERDNGVVLNWAVDVEQDYIRLLGLRRPMALVILAYFAVTLEEVRETWWANGSEFLAFIDRLNHVFVSLPIFQVAHIAGGVLCSVQGVLPAQAIGGVLQVTTLLASAGVTFVRVRKFLKSANTDIFAPRGLVCRIMTTKKMMAAINFTQVDKKAKLKLPPLETIHDLGIPHSNSAPASMSSEDIQTNSRVELVVGVKDPRLLRLQALEGYIATLDFNVSEPSPPEGWLSKMGQKPLHWANNRQMKALEKAHRKWHKSRDSKASAISAPTLDSGNTSTATNTNIEMVHHSQENFIQGSGDESAQLGELQMGTREEEKRKKTIKETNEGVDKKMEKAYKKEEKVANRILWIVIARVDGTPVEEESLFRVESETSTPE